MKTRLEFTRKEKTRPLVELQRGNFSFVTDEDLLCTIKPHSSAGYQFCPIYTQVGDPHRRLLTLLTIGTLPEFMVKPIENYELTKGRMICRGPRCRRRGVHPLIAWRMLCLPPAGQVQIKTDFGSIDIEAEAPWKQREGRRATLAWVFHRYAGSTYQQLADSPLFEHLSKSDRKRSVIRVVQRVACKLREAAASMEVTIGPT